MKNKKETRTCIACRKKDEKCNLIRLVKLNDEILIDVNQKIKSRGTYICKNEECLKKIMKNKAILKTFKINIDDEKYNELRGVILDK